MKKAFCFEFSSKWQGIFSVEDDETRLTRLGWFSFLSLKSGCFSDFIQNLKGEMQELKYLQGKQDNLLGGLLGDESITDEDVIKFRMKMKHIEDEVNRRLETEPAQQET
jgi:hypothetical protein